MKKVKRIIITLLQLFKRPYLLVRSNHVPLSTRINAHCVLVKCNIGKYCYIGQGSVLNHVCMGNYCSIAPNVVIGGMEHPYWLPSTSTWITDKYISGKITKIGNDVWIGANSVIKQGVSIGDGVVIGAGSVVTKDISKNMIVCGVPAKCMKMRFSESIWRDVEKSGYWNLTPPEAIEKIEDLISSNEMW